MKKLFSFIFASCAAIAVQAAETDYTQGVFIVNEDWAGHSNSTLNYILPDDPDGNYWHYRVIQTENPGMEIGSISEFGAIWNGRFYIISKFAKDGGASVTGGRITVADATTLKIIRQFENIAPEGTQCDGRAFVGVSASKAYVSTTNGIWVLDLDNLEITGQIKESAASDSPYDGECGSMVLADGKVFAVHRSNGLLVIDTATDAVTDVISAEVVKDGAGIGSVVLGADGNLWASIAGSSNSLPYLLRVDPASLDYKVIALPDGICGPASSWYAWTPDGFCASEQNKTLYWNGGLSSWASGYFIYRYDIETNDCTRIINFQNEPDNWQVYGCSMRVHPATDELYMSLFHTWEDQTYVLRRYSADGTLIREYPMEPNYWFPAIPIFPQSSNSSGITLPEADDSNAPAELFDLQGRPADRSTARAGIYIERRGTSVRKITLK